MTQHTKAQWGVLFAVAATQFAAPFMISAVGVALPHIGMDFHASGVALSLVESVFLGVSAMCLLTFGRTSDLMGRNWIFTLGIVIFILASVAIGFVQSVHGLIALRALQAVGGAMQVSTGLAILMQTFAPDERGRVLGITIAAIYLGLSAGPFIGGHIIAAFGWRWLFFLGVIPCILGLALTTRSLKWDLHPPTDRFDFPGAILSMLGIGLLVYGGATIDGPLGLPTLGASIVAIAVFIWLEARSDSPLLDIRLFTESMDFSTGNLLQFINYAASFGLTFLMSLYLQLGHGMSPVKAGTILVIQPLIQSLLTPISGRLADRRSPEGMVTAGMLLCATGLAWASTFDTATDMASIVGMLAVMGVGTALFVAPNVRTIMGAVTPANYGVATAVTSQMRIVGMTISMVAISMVISTIVGDKVLNHDTFGEFAKVMEIILVGGSAASCLGTLLSIVVPRLVRRRARRTEQTTTPQS